jgi:hypothetical protein
MPAQPSERGPFDRVFIDPLIPALSVGAVSGKLRSLTTDMRKQ